MENRKLQTKDAEGSKRFRNQKQPLSGGPRFTTSVYHFRDVRTVKIKQKISHKTRTIEICERKVRTHCLRASNLRLRAHKDPNQRQSDRLTRPNENRLDKMANDHVTWEVLLGMAFILTEMKRSKR